MIPSSQTPSSDPTVSTVHPCDSASNVDHVDDDDDVVVTAEKKKEKPPEPEDERFTTDKKTFASRAERNEMYSYYKLVWDRSESCSRAVCLRCKNRTKPASYKFSSSDGTTNMKRHAETHGFKGKKGDDESESNVAGTTLSAGSNFFKLVPKQVESNAETIRRLEFLWLITADQPFTEVENVYYRRKMQLANPGYKTMTGDTVRNILDKVYVQLQGAIMKLLDVSFISLFSAIIDTYFSLENGLSFIFYLGCMDSSHKSA